MRKILEHMLLENEKEEWFDHRTLKHIDLVQKAAKKIEQAHILNGEDCGNLMQAVSDHDASKLVEPERTPYVELTWQHKTKQRKYETPGTLPEKDINDATMHHILNNDHHPEFWNKEAAKNGKGEADDVKKVQCLDASKMPDLSIAEMVADWQAMSEELKKNTAREWYNSQKDVRWHFSEHQDELISRLLAVFE